jgi:hypothetical protein
LDVLYRRGIARVRPLTAAGVAIARRGTSNSMAPDPKEPPIVPPGKPWIEPDSPEGPPLEPSDPRKPWIIPNDPGESPVAPPEPRQPFVE